MRPCPLPPQGLQELNREEGGGPRPRPPPSPLTPLQPLLRIDHTEMLGTLAEVSTQNGRKHASCLQAPHKKCSPRPPTKSKAVTKHSEALGGCFKPLRSKFSVCLVSFSEWWSKKLSTADHHRFWAPLRRALLASLPHYLRTLLALPLGQLGRKSCAAVCGCVSLSGATEAFALSPTVLFLHSTDCQHVYHGLASQAFGFCLTPCDKEWSRSGVMVSGFPDPMWVKMSQ